MEPGISRTLAFNIDQMPGACGCKDEQSTYLYANEEFRAIAGLRSGDSIAGMTDFDLPGDMALHASTFREQDRYVIEKKAAVTTFNVYRMKCARINAYLVTKKPFTDPEGDAKGVLFHLTDLSALNVGLLGPYHGDEPHVFDGTNYPLGMRYVIAGGETDLDITRREYEVLFYMLRGATARRIGEFLCISSRTVEQYVTILKEKFEVPTKQELIEKAIQLGYYYVMPDSVFRPRRPVGPYRSVPCVSGTGPLGATGRGR